MEIEENLEVFKKKVEDTACETGRLLTNEIKISTFRGHLKRYAEKRAVWRKAWDGVCNKRNEYRKIASKNPELCDFLKGFTAERLNDGWVWDAGGNDRVKASECLIDIDAYIESEEYIAKVDWMQDEAKRIEQYNAELLKKLKNSKIKVDEIEAKATKMDPSKRERITKQTVQRWANNSKVKIIKQDGKEYVIDPSCIMMSTPGCWMPPDREMPLDPALMLTPESEGGAESLNTLQKMLERDYVLLAIIHDKVCSDDFRINNNILSKKVFEGLWMRLALFYCDKIYIVTNALDRVKVNLAKRKSAGGKQPVKPAAELALRENPNVSGPKELLSYVNEILKDKGYNGTTYNYLKNKVWPKLKKK